MKNEMQSFLATVSSDEFQNYLSTLDEDWLEALRKELFARLNHSAPGDSAFNRTMEQLDATKKHLAAQTLN